MIKNSFTARLPMLQISLNVDNKKLKFAEKKFQITPYFK